MVHNNLPVRLLFLSNMMAEKGVFVLLEACKLLKEKLLHFECDFVGEWFDISEEEFNRKVLRYNLTHHVFAYGGKYGKDKSPFFNQADIFVFPT
ncbi:MAG: glycosyltransferase [Segetibacter sp.]